MEPTADAAAPIDAPPLVPVEAAIDLKHLARMTLGERGLEAEVLMLFDRQAALLLDHMRQAAAPAIAAFAHTLKGSARGIGAWRVAAAAEVVEINAARDAGEVADAVARLAVAVDEARAVIAAWLEPHTCSG